MDNRIRAAFSAINADSALIEKTAAYLKNELQKSGKKSGGMPFRRLMSSLAAVFVIVAGLLSYNLYFTAAAHVSIDVNPSVEMTLNRFGTVIAAYAFNAEGELVLDEAGVRGKRYDEAAEAVISSIESDGFFTDDVLISVSVQAESSETECQLVSELEQLINGRAAAIQPSADVEVFPVSAEIWGNAHECHMSPAKYLAIQELMEVDETATVEAYSNSSVSQIRLRARECRETHGEAHSDDNANTPSSPDYGQGRGKTHGHSRGTGQGGHNHSGY